MDKRIDRLQERIEKVEAENDALKRALALLLAHSGLELTDLPQLKTKAKAIFNRLNKTLFE